VNANRAARTIAVRVTTREPSPGNDRGAGRTGLGAATADDVIHAGSVSHALRAGRAVTGSAGVDAPPRARGAASTGAAGVAKPTAAQAARALRRTVPVSAEALPGRVLPAAEERSLATPVIGYLSLPDPVSTEASRQSELIEASCTLRGWTLLETVRDRERGRILERSGLRYALERIARKRADVLLVGEMRRLSRSIVDLGTLMAWFLDIDATLIALDLPIDTSTASGREVASTLIALADWERERIARRTRRGLAEVRAHGQPVGRPAVGDDPELLERIWAMRQTSMTLRAIAERLNAERVPTLRGGAEWRPSSIQTALGYRRPGPRDHLPSPRAPRQR